MKNDSNVAPEDLQSFIVIENNKMNHNKKDNPFRKSYIYQITTGYSSIDYTTIIYNIQYIKYESDNGIFFKNDLIFSGITFSDINFYKNTNINYNDLKKSLDISSNSIIGTITFMINQSNFDVYKRSYQKLQSLIAEIVSVINLLFEIGRQISNILNTKKMSKDIIVGLMNNGKNDLLNKRSYNINKLFEKFKASSEKKINSKSIEKSITDINVSQKKILILQREKM